MSEKIATREAYGKALVELGEQNKIGRASCRERVCKQV